MLTRAENSYNLNAILNSPDVRPFAGSTDIISYLDLTNAIADKDNIFFECDSGGFIFLPQEDGEYDVHVFFHHGSRGKFAADAGQEALKKMFIEYKAKKIIAKIPLDNKRTHSYVTNAGFQFDGYGMYMIGSEVFEAKCYSIDKESWLCQQKSPQPV